MFLGSATVVYENPEDAAKAIEEYHRAYLDDKLLTVEYDAPNIVKVPKISRGTHGIRKTGKTLRVGDRRRGGARAGRR